MKKVAVTVKWFDTKNGFGFFKQEEGADIFVHISVLQYSGFEPEDMQEDLPAMISFAENKDGKLQCSCIHEIDGKKRKKNVVRKRKMQRLSVGDRYILTLKSFGFKKGYGFFYAPAGGDDLFVHISAIPEDLHDYLVKGNRFEVVIGENEDGRLLANVQALSPEYNAEEEEEVA